MRNKGLGIHLVFQILVKHFHPCQLPESQCVVGNEVFVVEGVEGSPAPHVAETRRRCRGARDGFCQRDCVQNCGERSSDVVPENAIN